MYFSVNSILRPGRFRRDPRQLDEEEEMWFNDDEYEDDTGPNTNSTNSPSGQTVTSPGNSIVSQSASVSPVGVSQTQTPPGLSNTSTASGTGNSSATGK